MGLAAPRNRTKIGSDPNNTKWSKSTTRFGHKILTSQGWKPGDTLGVEGAAHSSHYTAASSSHIRVLLREDNLGVGAKNGRQENDVVGLDMFQNLLGRLNGKSEGELEKEAGQRRDFRLRELSMKRFGNTTFVSGGYLIGDQIKKEIEVKQEDVKQEDVTQEDIKQEDIKQEEIKEVIAVRTKESKSKKRKLSQDEEVMSEKKQKTVKFTDEVLKKERRKNKKDKKRKSEALSGDSTEEDESARAAVPEPSEKEAKKVRKAEKRAAKEARRLEKEDRKRKKRKEKEASEKDSSTSDSETAVATPRTTLVQTAAVPRGRFHVRARYMQQKRLASSDPQALKEIFMIKAEA